MKYSLEVVSVRVEHERAVVVRMVLRPQAGRAVVGAAGVERGAVERVDLEWITAVAAVPDDLVGPLAGRWIGLLEEELGLLPREEKPWIRDLAAQIVSFARRSGGARDVIFAWGF